MSDASDDFGLPKASLDAIRLVLARAPRVVRAVVYGSRAKGTFRTGSDIDLTLFGEALTDDDLLAVDRAIDDLDLPYTVDLSLHAQIENPALRAHIARVGKDLYPPRAMAKVE